VKGPERARRFDLHLSLLYRSPGARSWQAGRIENISRSGVLFWTAQPMDVDTELEMRFVLPIPKASPRVVCHGRIVRAVEAAAAGAPSRVAATISAYRFVRGRARALDPHRGPLLPRRQQTR
jgi:hypothetical protein